MKIKLLAVISFLMICVGQNPVVQFENINSLNGLSQNVSYSVFQDRHGFIYIGQEEGFSRFDGKTFTSFKANAFDSTSIASPFINGFQEDADGYIWIATGNGISRFNPKTKRSKNYSPVKSEAPFDFTFIHSIFIDSKDRLWLMSNSGIFQFIKEEERFLRYSDALNFSRNYFYNGIQHFYENNQGEILYGNEFGLFKIDDTVYATHPYINSRIKAPIKKSIRSIVQTESFDYIVATNTGIIKFTKTDSEEALTLSDIVDLDIDANKNLWVATRNDGVVLSNEELSEFKGIRHERDNPNSLASNTLSSIYLDCFNVLWIATRDRGLSKLPLRNLKFSHFKHERGLTQTLQGNIIRSFGRLNSEEILIGSEKNGLSRYNPSSNDFRPFQKNLLEKLGSTRINYIFNDNEIVFVGTERQIIQFNRDGSKRIIPKQNRMRARARFITHIFKNEGQIWVGTRNGIFEYHPDTDLYSKLNYVYKDEITHEYISISDTKNDLRAHVKIGKKLYFSQWGKGIFIKTDQSDTLERIFYDGKNVTTIPSNQIVHLGKDNNDILYISTYGGGLAAYDTKTKTYYYINEDDGLPSNVTNASFIDQRNRLWISTNRGLSLYLLKKKALRHFTQMDGLQANEFVAGSFMIDKDQVYLGGVNGFNRFNPNEIYQDTIPPILNLSALEIAGEKRELNGNKIDIQTDEQYFTLVFSPIQSASQKDIQLKYSLSERDDDWQILRDNYISFNKLDYGNYTLKVKAINGDGYENAEAMILNLNIITPWYLSNWAYIIYLVLLYALVRLIRWIIINWRYIIAPRTKFFLHYKILNEIGSGGIGTVYEVIDLNTKKRMALKLIKNDDLNDESFLTTFLKEAELGQRLKHANIAEIYHAGNEENTKYLVMELLEGQTLSAHLKANDLGMSDKLKICGEILEGLNYIHSQDAIHRDLKSSNIMISKDKGVKIFDFGLSSATMLVSLADRTQRVGTLAYMSPEQTIGKNSDHRTDIYAFGVILYQLIYNRFPFHADNEMELIFAIHNDTPRFEDRFESYNNIIKKCLERTIESRYATVAELMLAVKTLN